MSVSEGCFNLFRNRAQLIAAFADYVCFFKLRITEGKKKAT